MNACVMICRVYFIIDSLLYYRKPHLILLPNCNLRRTNHATLPTAHRHSSGHDRLRSDIPLQKLVLTDIQSSVC